MKFSALPRFSALLAICATALAGCSKPGDDAGSRVGAPLPSPHEQERELAARYPDATATGSGLKYVVVEPGRGDAKPAKGQTVRAHYTLTLLNGAQIDSSSDRGQPFSFRVGQGEVIAAWDEAFLDMGKGEKRTLIVPPSLGYGTAGAGGGVIPPNAFLLFDVELVDFR